MAKEERVANPNAVKRFCAAILELICGILCLVPILP
jgi:hypothetical protein